MPDHARTFRSLVVATMVCAAFPGRASTLSPPLGQETGSTTSARSLLLRLKDRALAAAVGSALEGASRRLGRDECAAVFSDFVDTKGRTLQANLDALGATGPEYLRLIAFYDGRAQARCALSRAYAFTAAGSRVVWICERFAAEQKRDPGIAEATLIHEALHSLGLGEDPPSTLEITGRVVARCGR